MNDGRLILDDRTQVQHNSFATGFTLGVLTGAAGYFFFATDRGIRLRHQLLKEWDIAKERLVEEGVIEHQQVPFRHFLQDALQRFAGFAEQVSNPTTVAEVEQKFTKKLRSVPPKRPQSLKFRNV